MEKIKKLPDAEFDIMKVVWDNEIKELKKIIEPLIRCQIR